ncbi:MAG: MarR family transcriptional regulator [Subdoligranulum sp.]
MQLVNPLEQQNAVKTLYSEFVSPVCAKYGLTRIELDILLFLANNTRYDTATDIVEVRFLAKSQVSAAIKNLGSPRLPAAGIPVGKSQNRPPAPV